MRERDGTTRWEPIRLKRYPATGSKK